MSTIPTRLAAVANVRLPTEKAHGVQMMSMCAGFAAAGSTVTLFAPRRLRNPVAGDPFRFYGMPPAFGIRMLPTCDLLPWQRFLGSPAFWAQRLSFLCSALYATRGCDAVWTRDEIFAAAWGVLHRAPFVLEVHAPSTRAAWAYRAAARRGRVVAISGGVRDALTAMGVPAQRVTVLHDAVDAERFRPQDRLAARRMLGLAEHGRYVAYTGHLYRWKGAHVLAEASALLPEDVTVLIIGGTDEDSEAFQKFLDDHGLARVRLVGRRPAAEIPAWLAAADAVAVPTSGKELIGRSFTSPLKLFEAMSMARPIVASNLPSLREVLTDDVDALLADPDDARAFAAALTRVLTDQVLAKRLAAGARAAAAGRTWEARASEVLRLLAP